MTPPPPPTTNVPPITWVNGMPVVPTEQQVLAGRQADFTAAYGSGLNLAPTTGQGQVITSDTAIIGDKNAAIAYVSNQVDPDFAEGAWQDALGAIYFLERIAAAGSVKSTTCIGGVGVLIPAGSLIKDPSGYLWAATLDINIGSTGQATGTFQNQTTGPIAWLANTTCTIYTQVDGWDQCVSSADAAQGRNVESRAAFENRRRQSVAINSHGTPPAILGNVLAVPNVLSAYVIDNPTNGTVNVGTTNYATVQHSVLVSAYGGNAAQIAQAVWTAKDGGCNYNGNTTVNIFDTSYPLGSQPEYAVTFLIPTPTPIYFAVALQNSTLLPSNIKALVQQAVLATFNGTDAQESVPAGIALTISGSRYSAQINAISPAVNIETINVGLQTVVSSELVGTGNNSTVTFTHTAANLNVVPGTVVVTAGTVVASDDGNGNLVGPGITSGTINYATGALSIGYVVAPAIIAIDMAYSYSNPSTGIVTMGVDQMPTLNADSIVVTLV